MPKLTLLPALIPSSHGRRRSIPIPEGSLVPCWCVTVLSGNPGIRLFLDSCCASSFLSFGFTEYFPLWTINTFRHLSRRLFPPVLFWSSDLWETTFRWLVDTPIKLEVEHGYRRFRYDPCDRRDLEAVGRTRGPSLPVYLSRPMHLTYGFDTVETHGTVEEDPVNVVGQAIYRGKAGRQGRGC
jgi:hypothetical protein